MNSSLRHSYPFSLLLNCPRKLSRLIEILKGLHVPYEFDVTYNYKCVREGYLKQRSHWPQRDSRTLATALNLTGESFSSCHNSFDHLSILFLTSQFLGANSKQWRITVNKWHKYNCQINTPNGEKVPQEKKKNLSKKATKKKIFFLKQLFWCWSYGVVSFASYMKFHLKSPKTLFPSSENVQNSSRWSKAILPELHDKTVTKTKISRVFFF